MKTKLLIFVFTMIGIVGVSVFVFPKFKKDQTVPTSNPVEDFVNQSISDNRGVPVGENAEDRVQNEQNQQVKNTDVNVEAICQGEQASDFYCYEEYYTALVREKDIKTAFADLRGRYDENGYIKSQCHPLTHVIGRIAAEKFAKVAGAYVEGDAFCWSGYYHGVLEGVIGKIGYSNLPGQMNGICTSLAQSKPYSFDHYNCVHGLGHGVMAVNQNELFDALKICDNVTDIWERASCWSGAFMENVIVDNKNHFTKYLKPEDPVYPCNAVGDDYKSICYLMQTSYMLKVLNGSYEKVFEVCGGIEEAHRTTCYESLGRDISGRSTSNAAATKSGCNLGTDFTQRRHCIIGAVKDFISYYHSDVQANELCQMLTEEKDLQDVCFQTAESYYKLL